MNLASLAAITGATPKWILNTTAALGRPSRYTPSFARHLTLTRVLHDELGLPLRAAHDLAGRAIAAWEADPSSGAVPLALAPDGLATVTVDMPRALAEMAARESLLHTTRAPRMRGRPRAPTKDPITRAAAYGLDLSLLRANLARTPAERLRQLDGMAAFAKRARRTRA